MKREINTFYRLAKQKRVNFVDIYVKHIVKMECDTESLIKRKAKELYFSKGVFNASTQEIADFAGVNRTLVNYYFRSKKTCFRLYIQKQLRK